MDKKIRVRFAPSPTGPLHIGGLRTALYNYLFAKKYGGDFILRIEDTDQSRYVPGAEAYILESLQWCGISYDEGIDKEGNYGPYRQSERKELYREQVHTLIAHGWAYYAFDSPEELEGHRKKHLEQGKTFSYSHHNRSKLTNSLSLNPNDVTDRIARGEKYVVRFKTPENDILTIHDGIRGAIQINTNTLDDKVLFKSDGMPTYHLANVVDDHLMGITHVIRGEEWLPSLPFHVLLYKAFKWETPLFAHLPLILKPVGKGKLSKRDGEVSGFPVFPLQWPATAGGKPEPGYREAGYFPQAVVNMLALLGWNPGTEQELFSLSELASAFSLERVNKSGARFDPEKSKWFNQQYLIRMPDSELARLFAPLLREKGIKTTDSYVEKVVGLLKERAVFVADFWESGNFFFVAPDDYEPKAVKKQWKTDTPALMRSLIGVLQAVEDFNAASIEKELKAWVQSEGIALGKIMQPFRLSLAGALKGPQLFVISEMIGKGETIRRIQNAIESLS